ncbi:hypothetical protein C2S51_021837 [Perilla frutescens var. frutescens]|nr:hypothetical protein C2S51_021837 [Perilla frutescens var. frutescens]
MERAVLSIVLSTVRDLLLEETRFLYGVRREVRVLETKLKEIQCLLDDAERRKHDNKISRNWITQIKDLAHRAEDVILTYAVQVSSRRGQRLKQRLHRFSCILCECCSLHQIGSEISEITSELDRVTKSMLSFGLRNIIEGESSTMNTTCSDNQRWKRLAFPVEKEDCFVGKEDELKRLLSLLTEDTQHLVIGLWGTGGIGKTTIARKVYNHTDVSSSFKCFAWVCITQRCEIRSVLEDVLKQLTQGKKDHISSLSDTELVVQLCKVQRSKRCMIVLDALWKIDHWTGLKHAFLIEGSNSKILLTTRNHDIATIGYAFEVGLLNMHDGWELLKKKAFPNSNSVPAEFADQESSLQKIGEEMVRRCSYLPLVISLLGRVLSTRASIEKWEEVKNNINAYLYKGKSIDKEKEIHKVLRLSYDDLPYYLKPCFLYMGQFLEGGTIDVNVLYRRWIAQGMISHENRGNEETLMDTAELYLSELVSRCIVQVEVHEGIEGKKYIECRLHDVIRELCLSLGEEEEFGLKIFDYKGGRFSALLHECLSGTFSKTRHLVIHFRAEMELEPDHGKFTISSDVVRYVRSLSFCVIPGWERLTDYGYHHHNSGKFTPFRTHNSTRVQVHIGTRVDQFEESVHMFHSSSTENRFSDWKAYRKLQNPNN